MTRRRRIAVAVALAAVAAGLTVPALAATPTPDGCARVREEVAVRTELLDAAVAAGGLSTAERAQINRERAINAAALRTCAAVPSPSAPAPTPTAGDPPPPSPTPPGSSPTPSPSPTGPAGWPGPDNTGVPAGTTLSPYTGPCTITAANTVIDARAITCDLVIATTGVTIRRSYVTGTVGTGESAADDALRLTIEDSTIDAGKRQATGLGADSFRALRVEVVGGNRGVYCRWRCELRDSWVHGTWVQDNWHASAVRAERYSTLVHNTLACDWLVPTAQDGGCSANLTGYPDFAPPHDWTIERNLFVANPTGAAFCAYGGSSAGKPYSGHPDTGTRIAFRDNVFQRGSNRNCAAYGPIDSYNSGAAGAVWSGNVWDDGTAVQP